MTFRQLLTTKGIHFFVTRFGPSKLRSLAFDEKYRNGTWDFTGDGTGELPALISRYLVGGNLLILGCGQCSVLEGLRHANFASALGVDLSSEAIRVAGAFASDKISFLVADMLTFEPTLTFDVVLFSESLYYVPSHSLEGFLRRLSKNLNPDGVFIVTLAQARRYQSMLRKLRSTFTILDDHAFSTSDRHLIVFNVNGS